MQILVAALSDTAAGIVNKPPEVARTVDKME